MFEQFWANLFSAIKPALLTLQDTIIGQLQAWISGIVALIGG